MNSLALLCLVASVSVVAAAAIALAAAVLGAKEGFEDETGFHAGDRTDADPRPAPVMTRPLPFNADCL